MVEASKTTETSKQEKTMVSRVEFLIEVRSKKEEATRVLDAHQIPYKLIKNTIYRQKYDSDSYPALPLIDIGKGLYSGLKEICNLLNIELNKFVTKILDGYITDFLGFQPLDFLDENTDLYAIPNIYELLQKLHEIHPLDDLEYYKELTTKENLRRDKDGLLQVKKGKVWKYV